MAVFIAQEDTQYHYDIGYGGLFAHYRSTVPMRADPEFITGLLKTLKSHMSTEKKGVLLEDLAGLMDCYEQLREAGFYMVNFETKTMSEAGTFPELKLAADC